METWQDFKLWIFRCRDYEMLYFIVAVSQYDAMEFLVEAIANHPNGAIPFNHLQESTELNVCHPDFGWIAFYFEHRNMFRGKITPDTQYGIIYTLP